MPDRKHVEESKNGKFDGYCNPVDSYRSLKMTEA